jgi:hypothetical protein
MVPSSSGETMGVGRIFVCAVVGTLIPTAIMVYLLMSPAAGNTTELKACAAAEGFVRQSLGADKSLSFVPCDQIKEKNITGDIWQVMGEVEIANGTGPAIHEAYLARIDLGDDSAPRLETLSLR